ncbi:hypothetical protein M408DRAFT_27191 [Serendipita vermifera MAFF 305830]|uniref:Uncharacterized protein n=1 Tax=Serendipita vermifera MAFF 305830 TaxID=933852 RepID=A0A0C2WCN2_SERVB|nr:hypothetical protein M408DRAFT_27191 [Serendipita vermifera MAFF 305830]
MFSTCPTREFYNFLVDPSLTYIWKRVREGFVVVKRAVILSDGKPDLSEPISPMEIINLPGSKCIMQVSLEKAPIPDPFSGQSEYAMARMLFGRKTCLECGEEYSGKPRSFPLPLPFCPECTQSKDGIFDEKHYVQKTDALKEFQEHILISHPGVDKDALDLLWRALPKARPQNRIDIEYALRPSWNRLLAEFADIVTNGSISAVTEFLQVGQDEGNERKNEYSRMGPYYLHFQAILMTPINMNL